MTQKFSISAFFRSHFTGILLASVLTGSAVSIYTTTSAAWIFSAAGFAAIIGYFLVLDFCNRRQNKYITCGIFLGLLALGAALAFSLVFAIEGANFMNIGMWALQPNDTDVRRHPEFAAAVTVAFSFFFSFTIFYFSTIIYRSLTVFLICICPFALFAKTFTDIPIASSVLTVILYFMLMFSRSSAKSAGTAVTAGKKGYYATSAVFVLAVIAAAAFVPKPEAAPFREQFDELITGVQIKGIVKGEYGNFTDKSGDAENYSDDDTMLYSLSGEPVKYLRRQVFDIYDGGSWSCLEDEDYNTGYNYWRSETNTYNLELISEYLAEYLPDDERVAQYADSVSSDISRTTVQKEYSSSGRIVMSVGGMTEVSGFLDGASVYRTPKDEYFTSDSRGRNDRYTLLYRKIEVDGDFSDYITVDLINSVLYNYDYPYEDSEGRDAAMDYVSRIYEAWRYDGVSKTAYRGQDKVEALAEEITKDCTTDLERARAIERYFHTNGFVYDINYTAEDKNVEYFLFESKRGTCSDFATAMTLMARSVGICARYVEGFAVSETTDEGSVVRASDAHAFPELFINDRGWVIFEPTVAAEETAAFDETFFIIIIGIIASAAVLAAALAAFMRPRIVHARLRRRYAKAHGAEKAAIAFEAAENAVCGVLGRNKGTLTAADMEKILRDRYGIDGTELCESYNRAVFGGEDVRYGGGFSVYEKLLAAIKAEKKAEKKQRRQPR